MRIQTSIFIFVISLFLSGAVFAQEDFSIPVSIPKELAKIESIHPAGHQSGPWVIQIEDAHCVRQAQKNISDLLNYLQKKYKINYVYLEGGEGRLDVSRLAQNVLEEKLNRGEISGAEYAAAMNQNDAVYYGIENQKLYNLNRTALLEAAKSRSVRDRILAGLRERLSEKRGDVDLLLKASRLDLERKEYEKFKEIYTRFDSFFDSANISPQSPDWVDLAKLFEPVVTFYNLVLERDQAIAQNVLKRIKEDRASMTILVTGGFHSKAIADSLSQEGISSIVVSPEFSSWAGRENYLRALKKVRVFA